MEASHSNPFLIWQARLLELEATFGDLSLPGGASVSRSALRLLLSLQVCDLGATVGAPMWGLACVPAPV
eukprot:1332632-Prymnesium_polylepis.1